MRKRSWVWRLAAVVAALALALGLAACGGDDDSGASSDTSGGASETVNVAYVTTAQHPYGIAVDAFAKEVNATGALTLKGQPGYPQSEIQLLDDVQSGAVKMATVSTRGLGHRRHHGLPGAPGAVPDPELRPRGSGDRRRHRQVDDRRRPTEEGRDQIVLAIHEGGLRKPFAVKPKLVSLADWKGKTIRAPQSKVLAAGIQALGANADPLPLPDVNQALQNGTVDGMEANFGLVVHPEAVRGRQELHRQREPLALPDGAGRQQGLVRLADRRPAGGAHGRGREDRPRPRWRSSRTARRATSPRTSSTAASSSTSRRPSSRPSSSQAGSTATSALASESQAYVKDIQQLKDVAAAAAQAPPPLPTEKTGCVRLDRVGTPPSSSLGT